MRAPIAALLLLLGLGAATARGATPAGGPPPGVTVVMESCDLWSSPAMWRSVRVRAPGNQPLSGPYDDAQPSVAEARAALLLSAGVSAEQSCWFRAKGNAGQPVRPLFEGVIRALAAGGGARDRMRWSLFWDNSNPVGDGVSGPADFLDHLVPFWIDTYLRRPNYLRLDNRPLLVIASAARLVQQLGGPDAARIAIAGFRDRVRRAGLTDVFLLACNNADPTSDNHLAREVGFDGVMAYATPIFTGLLGADPAPGDQAVMRAERQSWADWRQDSALTPAITVSLGYDARIWSKGGTHYLLSPAAFAGLLRQGLAAAAGLPAGRRLLFIDNWNEYGEGRFIEPSLAQGDRYFRAMAGVLAPGPVAAGR